MIDLRIGRQVIPIPSINEDPNWASGIIKALQALTGALQFTFGNNDIPPQAWVFASNASTNVDIVPLRFSVNAVRGAYIYYAIYRQTDTNSEAEVGTLELVYNPNNATGSKWTMSRSYTGGSTVQFNVDDSGQVSYSTQLLPGANFTGNLVFKASALQQTY